MSRLFILLGTLLALAFSQVQAQTCTADAGTLSPETSEARFSYLTGPNDSSRLAATPNGDDVVPAGYAKLFVLTSGNSLVIEQVNTNPEFFVKRNGIFTIHTLIYDPNPTSPNFLDLSVVQFGVTTGGDVLGLVVANGICASLDVAGTRFFVKHCRADAGTLTATASAVTLQGGSATISATPDGNDNFDRGFAKIFVLTSGSGLIIEQVNSSPTFTVTAPGLYTIHTLIYDPRPASQDFLDLSVVQFGTTTGVDVLNIVTTNNICASLDVAGAPVNVSAGCTADAGTLSPESHPVRFPFLTGNNDTARIAATPNGDDNVPAGYSKIFVLTKGNSLTIQAVNTIPEFFVTSGGLYTIHTLIYNADPTSPDFLDLSIVQFGVTTGVDVLNLVTANGICASLDVAGAKFGVRHCRADAGTLTADSSLVILQTGGVTITATPDGNDYRDRGFDKLYVLTSGSGLVIEQVNTTPSFTVNTPGLYTIHTLIYDPRPASQDFLDLSVVQFGTTTGVDVLNIVGANAICADLDVAGAPINVTACPAFAGTLSPAVITDPVLTGANDTARLAATPNGDENVPAGYSKIFVLTSGANLVIQQVSATPEFFVTSPGLYTIHTLVFNADTSSVDFLDLSVVQFGTTTGGDVLALVGSAGICADLDVAGTAFNVGTCAANAGTLTATASTAALANGTATISATPDGNDNVPAGYSKIFVLTSGAGLVIEQVGVMPSFTVNQPGLYTIHTLVFDGRTNSADFLDLSVVQFGTTTGVDVLNIVTANSICASLDVAGAPITVTGCGANAGTLSPESHILRFSYLSGANDTARIAAVPNGDEVVPAGYSKIFVLTKGNSLTIEAVNTVPEFFVTSTGLYTIHTLVYNADPTSPDFLDLSIVQFGVTTGVDVLNVVGANNICASLDVAGTQFFIKHCRADAGTLTAMASQVAISHGKAVISAIPDGNDFMDRGYAKIFVLTSGSGLVIEDVNTAPLFHVTNPGQYTIHTLVYDPRPTSPDFLDLSVVQFGVTTGVDVLNLVIANGLCASLDVPGAPITVTAGGNRLALSEQVSVFPTPAQDVIKVEATLNQQLAYRLTDLNGKELQRGTFDFVDQQVQSLNISNLAEGIYQLMLIDNQNGAVSIEKIIKQ